MKDFPKILAHIKDEARSLFPLLIQMQKICHLPHDNPKLILSAYDLIIQLSECFILPSSGQAPPKLSLDKYSLNFEKSSIRQLARLTSTRAASQEANFQYASFFQPNQELEAHTNRVNKQQRNFPLSSSDSRSKLSTANPTKWHLAQDAKMASQAQHELGTARHEKRQKMSGNQIR